jgi:hypothetical protein
MRPRVSRGARVRQPRREAQHLGVASFQAHRALCLAFMVPFSAAVATKDIAVRIMTPFEHVRLWLFPRVSVFFLTVGLGQLASQHDVLRPQGWCVLHYVLMMRRAGLCK